MDAKFTMDFVWKDLNLVEKLRKKFNIYSKLIPTVEKIFLEGKNKLGKEEYSAAIIKIIENKCGEILSSKGFSKKINWWIST